MTDRIAIVGRNNDLEVKTLKERLEERGARVAVVDFSRFPYWRSVAFTGDDMFLFDDVNLLEQDAAYIRWSGYIWPPLPDERPEVAEWEALYDTYVEYLDAESANCSIKDSLLRVLGYLYPVINPQPLQELHRLKLIQLTFLRENGFPVPDMVISNDTDRLARFRQRSDPGYGTVRKPLAGYFKTRLVDQDGDAERKLDLNNRPYIYQQYIRGETIRCYMVGDRVAGAGEILHGNQVDCSIDQRGVRVVDLPAEAEKLVLDATRALGLYFSGVDLQHDLETDRYYVLECNISPMFTGFFLNTGIDVPGALADLLLEAARGDERWKRLKAERNDGAGGPTAPRTL